MKIPACVYASNNKIMTNVRLCDAIMCQPSLKDELCIRCISAQYDNLIEEIDDCECLDDYEFDEELNYPTDFY